MVARPDTAQHIVHEITALMPCYDSGCRILEISVLILIPTEKGFISPLAQAAMVEPSMQEDKKKGKGTTCHKLHPCRQIYRQEQYYISLQSYCNVRLKLQKLVVGISERNKMDYLELTLDSSSISS